MERVTIVNNSRGTIFLNSKELRLSRKIPYGGRIILPLETVEAMLYETGIQNMFRKGSIVILTKGQEDLKEKLRLDNYLSTNIFADVVLNDRELIDKIKKATPKEMEQMLKIASFALRERIASLIINHSVMLDGHNLKLIKKYSGKDVEKALMGKRKLGLDE